MATTSKNKGPGALYEVLTEAPNGHRTVHRFRAASVAEARSSVEDGLADGFTVLDAAEAGTGLGSGDGGQYPGEA